MATFSVRLEAREADREFIRELSLDLDPDADGIEIVRAAEKLGERLGLIDFTITVVGAGAVVGDASITPDAKVATDKVATEVLPDRTAELTAIPSIRWAEWRYARHSVDTLIGPRKPRGRRSSRATSLDAMTLLGDVKPL